MPFILSEEQGTLAIGLTSSVGYFFCCFARYPIFMLPTHVQQQTLFEVFGKPMPVQTALSLAYLLGKGLSTAIAVPCMTSPWFFARRGKVLCALSVFGALGPLAAGWTQGEPFATVLGTFVGCLPLGCMYGGALTFVEGRRASEWLMATMCFSFIAGGAVSRGAAHLALHLGTNPCWMPFVVSVCALPPILAMWTLLDGTPPPSAMDVARRHPRSGMTAKQRADFMQRYGPGIGCIMVGMMFIASLRLFRDIAAIELFTAASGTVPSPLELYFMDVPGALTACAIMPAAGSSKNNYVALQRLMSTTAVLVAVPLFATFGFVYGGMEFLDWQVATGIGLHATYGLLAGSPVFERLVAATGEQPAITCSYLIYVGDSIGYLASTILMCWSFVSLDLVDDDSEDRSENRDPRAADYDILSQFLHVQAVLSAGTIVALGLAMYYFHMTLRPARVRRWEVEMAYQRRESYQ